jgi:predicted peptidase
MPSIAPVATPELPSLPKSTVVKPKGGGTFTAGLLSAPEGSMPYRLYVPVEYDSARRYPLVIWLHGAGGSGSDNKAQIAGDQIPGTQLWTKPEIQSSDPAFVLVPQSNIGWSTDGTGAPAPSVALVLQIMDLVSLDFPIDAHRVYLLGQSAGGGGAWNLLINHPERFAAVVLVCPVISSTNRLKEASKVPAWVFMGALDGMAPAARAAVLALRQAGGSPRYTEYAGAGHDIWTRVFKEPELPRWLFAQTR